VVRVLPAGFDFDLATQKPQLSFMDSLAGITRLVVDTAISVLRVLLNKPVYIRPGLYTGKPGIDLLNSYYGFLSL
jgi:hypothetical protein